MYRPYVNVTNNKRVIEQFRSATFLLEELLAIYPEYHAIQHIDVRDARAFQWHNYHEKEKGVFDIQLAYSAVLSLENKTEQNIIADLRYNRRQEIKRAKDLIVENSTDIEKLKFLHDKTFERQGINLSEEDNEGMAKIARAAIQHGFGDVTTCLVDGEVASSTLFLYDNKRSYYLIGANDPDLRNTGASTKLMFEKILESKNKGLRELDFVGANSPQRGDYKVSFNADVFPYFITSIRLK